MISNLFSEVLKASGLEVDHRFKSWAKFVDQVDQSKADGYAFVGDFIPGGTVEYDPRERLILVASTSGSMKYNYCYYRLVRMHADGSLEPTDIRTDGKASGWTLRIRDQVAALLSEIDQTEPESPLASIPTDDLVAELARRGIAVAA